MPPLVGTGPADAPAETISLASAREIQGSTPLLLDDPDELWVVEEGKVDVFAVEADSGARRHLFSAGPGRALLGADPAWVGGTLRLIGVGIQGTRADKGTQFASRLPALQVHLKEPILRVQKPECAGGVGA